MANLAQTAAASPSLEKSRSRVLAANWVSANADKSESVGATLGANANEEEELVENAVFVEARGAVKASDVEAKRAMVAMAENFMMMMLLLALF